VTTTENITRPAYTSDLLRHMADLDDLMVEAYGDHPALAAVRAEIAAEMDRTSKELARYGISIPEPF
jgi:predicted TIM-barrel enzyme